MGARADRAGAGVSGPQVVSGNRDSSDAQPQTVHCFCDVTCWEFISHPMAVTINHAEVSHLSVVSMPAQRLEE